MKHALGAMLLAMMVVTDGSLTGISAQTGRMFKARLSVVPLDVAMQSTISGSGSVSAVLSGTTLVVSGTFEGLRSPATIAQVHRGPKGIRGPVAFDLAVSKAASGTLTGKIDLTPAQVADIENGRLYVQLHSEKAPEGNLWGWLLQEKRP